MIGKKQASLMLESLRNTKYVEELADIYKNDYIISFSAYFRTKRGD
ncbi:MAG: hypothetical protein KIIPBIDF_01268 [Candidatus Methanoperedenaceae archaeon GB50]|nr:MAG: hypothetical protein KIIPBIDF_01268 [Candidatus Methanoperedenaceae archaeon GB50]